VKLVLSQYLRTLRERNEFDRLLPELVTEMGYVPLVKPKAGIRQYGVDFPAVGKSPQDGVDELLLFVIKQGDITRRVWSGETDRVRESLEEVVDVYLNSHVPPEYRSFRKVIVLATTGDLAQDVQLNWASFAEKHPEAVFRFWGADQVAELLEANLLNEHLFDPQDRSDLRKSLALAGDGEYRFQDFCRLLLRQLGLAPDGSLAETVLAQDRKALVKALRRVHLAAMVCAYWADADGERRQALWVMERTVLWAFHRARLQELEQRNDVLDALADIWHSYCEVGNRYYDRILEHIHVKDGLSGYSQEGAEYSVTLFEHTGLLATLGIGQIAVGADDTVKAQMAENARTVADALAALLVNHPGTGSPRLDHQVIDVCLGLALFHFTGQEAAAKLWLNHLAGRLNFVFMTGRLFPVGTDSLDDLVELDAGGADDEFKALLKQTSWLLATIASWCAVLGLDDVYRNLADGHNRHYPEVGAQIWHPPEDWSKDWYFGPAHVEGGASEAPYPLPAEAKELRARIEEFNAGGRLKWEENSPARAVGLWAIDFVACRHFRTPVPASIWYHIHPRTEAPTPAHADSHATQSKGGTS
jgi:hypothetical protein